MVICAPNFALWDFDGTLGHRRHGTWAECVLEVLDRQQPDHHWSFAEVFEALSTGFPWHASDTPHPHLADADRWWAHVTDVITKALTSLSMSAEDASTAAHSVRAAYTDPAAWSLYPQTLTVLDTLIMQGWSHVLLSNHVPELPAILDALGLTPRLHAVINSAATGYEKPHPAAFAHARALATDASRTWMIGDNAHADIAGANASGLDAIWVRRSRPGDIPDLAEAARIIQEDKPGRRAERRRPRTLKVAPLLESSPLPGPDPSAKLSSVRTAEAR
ncbi:HAD family hydrolase [Streptomyces sp. NPDC058471]|uniref:HAD family hydrolase n=1 Tax=Streptomyces sp. NPDC058471 TaxID=3346516 RepID=UPI003652C0EA